MSFLSLIVVTCSLIFASSAFVGGYYGYPYYGGGYYGGGYYGFGNGYYGGSYYGGYGVSTYKPYYQYSPFKNYYTGYLNGSRYYTPSCVQTGYPQFGSSYDFYYYQHVYSNNGLYQSQFNTCYRQRLPCYVSSGRRYFSTCTTLRSPCGNYCGQGQYCSQNSHFRSFTCLGKPKTGFLDCSGGKRSRPQPRGGSTRNRTHFSDYHPSERPPTQ